MKFSNKLSFSIIISGLIVLLVISFILYNLTYNSLIKSQLKYTEYITAEISENLDQILHEKIKTAITISTAPIIKNILETSCLSYENMSNEKRNESIKDPTDSFILNYTNNKVSHFLKKQQAIFKNEYGKIYE